MDCEKCRDPACALVAGHWYCLRHVRDLAQAAVDALADLVDLKDGPRDQGYLERKPLAWERAREALGR